MSRISSAHAPTSSESVTPHIGRYTGELCFVLAWHLAQINGWHLAMTEVEEGCAAHAFVIVPSMHTDEALDIEGLHETGDLVDAWQADDYITCSRTEFQRQWPRLSPEHPQTITEDQHRHAKGVALFLMEDMAADIELLLS